MKNKLLHHQALICECGHLVTGNLSALADRLPLYCSQCGQPCISSCPSCGAPIHGDCYKRQPVYAPSCSSSLLGGSGVYYTRTPKDFSDVFVSGCVVPAYCYNCGSPYPWTDTLLREAEGIVDLMDELTEEQKSALKECFPSLISDMPTTPRNSLIAAKLLQSASSISKTALQNLLADHLTALVLSLLGWKS